MQGINTKLIEAAKRIMHLDATPPTPTDAEFLSELIGAVDNTGDLQFGIVPLIIYEGTSYVVSQGPTIAAMGEVAYQYRETQLSPEVGLIRDVVCQMSVSPNTAWRIEGGLGILNTGVHEYGISAMSKIAAMIAILDAVGYHTVMMPFEAAVGPEDIMIPLPAKAGASLVRRW